MKEQHSLVEIIIWKMDLGSNRHTLPFYSRPQTDGLARTHLCIKARLLLSAGQRRKGIQIMYTKLKHNLYSKNCFRFLGMFLLYIIQSEIISLSLPLSLSLSLFLSLTHTH